jgi:hypothetical protein
MHPRSNELIFSGIHQGFRILLQRKYVRTSRLRSKDIWQLHSSRWICNSVSVHSLVQKYNRERKKVRVDRGNRIIRSLSFHRLDYSKHNGLRWHLRGHRDILWQGRTLFSCLNLNWLSLLEHSERLQVRLANFRCDHYRNGDRQDHNRWCSHRKPWKEPRIF